MGASRATTKIKSIWQRLRDGAYRHAYVSKLIGDKLAVQIYSMRISRRWTQADLAQKTGMKQSRISRLEGSCDHVSLNTLRRIAKVFDVALVVKFVPFRELVREIATESIDKEIPSFDSDVSPIDSLYHHVRMTSRNIVLPAYGSTERWRVQHSSGSDKGKNSVPIHTAEHIVETITYSGDH